MRIIKFLLSFATTGGLVFLLNNSHNVKGLPIPALGSLLSPFEGYWRNGKSILSVADNHAFKGLTNKVNVVYDDRAIPHIFADNVEDAYFTEGYLHAENRLWQMEFLARAAAGRLSEVLGNRALTPTLSTVDVDKLSRHRGIGKGAERSVEEWKKDAFNWKIIESYCMGANAYINALTPNDYPIEYKIFGVKPEPWSPLKMALVTKYMALDLASGSQDMQATNAKTLFGDSFDALFPEYFKEQSPIVPTGTSWNFAKTTTQNKAKPTTNDLSMVTFPNIENETQPDENNGSNNWAVAASKTKNHRPILCGDPHLSLRLPSIWYELQISTPEMNTYGVSIPGAASIVIGFNDNIAWTITNVGHDVVDWLTIKWKDKNKMEYMLDGSYRKVALRIEDINIKGGGSVKDTVKYTVWGPVVYENDSMPNSNMAFRWLANEVIESSPATFYKLNKARNYTEYAAALQDFNVPASNFAFACKDGDIALRVQGAYPLKPKEQGRFVQDGSLSSSSWKQLIPKDNIPFYKNPARGYVSSANQHSTDPSYPYYYNSEHFEAYRGRIVNNLLSKMGDSITVQDMMNMQNDNSSLLAAEALPNMIKNVDTLALNPAERALLTQLKAWNLRFDADLTAPVMFIEWFNDFYDNTWDEVVSRSDKDLILKPTWHRTVFMLRDEPQSKFFDKIATKDVKETSKDVLTASFKAMALDLIKLQAEVTLKYPANPTLTWAHYKDTEVPHISKIPGLGRSHIQNGGHSKSINAVKKDHGPSWRMIVELGDKPRAWVVYPGGQSGNPGSPHYDDFIDKWAKGTYYEAVFLTKVDEKHDRLKNTQSFSPVK